MKLKNKVAFLLFVALGSLQTIHAQKIKDYYKINTIQIPKNIILEVGGIDFDDKGRLGVCTRRGEVWLIDNPKSNTPNFLLFAQGMHENLGLKFKNGSFYTVQRSELTKLTDTNNDDKADLYKSIYNWEVSGNYHEYSFGPEMDANGDMFVTLNLGWTDGGRSLRKWRGWLIKISPKGEMSPIATGMRSPAGFGFNNKGDLFYAENQGDWVGSGRVSHIEKGDFLGHPEGLKWSGEPGSPVKLKIDEVDGKTGMTMYDYAKVLPALKPPSVWFPHTIMGVSTSDIKLIPDNFGPFGGQLLVGDQGHSKLMRMSQEIVNGVYQGACFPFLDGFESGVLRMRWSKEGDLYVGMTSRGWPSVGKKSFGLQRVEWNGKTPFEMKHIAVTENGYEIEFTQPVDETTAKNIDSYKITDFNYNYWRTYGSPIINKENRTIQKIDILDGGKKVRLYLDNMRLGYIYEIKAEGIKNTNANALSTNVCYYTLNQLPGGKSFQPLVEVDPNTAITEKIKESTKRITTKPSDWKESEIETINLSTVTGLQYNKKLIEVKAGTKVKLVFENPDDMLHNFLLTKPGTVEKVVKAAFNLGLDGQDQNFVPEIPEVLYHTQILQPKSKDIIYFEVPKKKGDYTYVCTFPGHGQVMRGILRVK